MKRKREDEAKKAEKHRKPAADEVQKQTAHVEEPDKEELREELDYAAGVDEQSSEAGAVERTVDEERNETMQMEELSPGSLMQVSDTYLTRI